MPGPYTIIENANTELGIIARVAASLTCVHLDYLLYATVILIHLSCTVDGKLTVATTQVSILTDAFEINDDVMNSVLDKVYREAKRESLCNGDIMGVMNRVAVEQYQKRGFIKNDGTRRQHA